MDETLTWAFPLPRPHTGLVLGNAVTGLMVWGSGATLRITVGRADLWDHRGGMAWSERHTYAEIRRLLENHDEAGLRELFKTDTADQPGQPERPSLIPVGRIEIDLGRGAELREGVLRLGEGAASIRYTRDGADHALDLVLAMERQAGAIRCGRPDEMERWDIRYRPAYTLSDGLKERSFDPPRLIDDGEAAGWFQPLPVDEGIAVLGRRDSGGYCFAVGRSQSAAARELSRVDGWEGMAAEAGAWWERYWQDIPAIDTPDALINELYAYGMYKFAGFSQPSGNPGGLQGPWIEDDGMPPWSGDYHFNINVQMCYWPAYKSGKLAHLRPLFDMIFGWEQTLRDNARKFIGIDDGVMLPHAVDDRCTCMGGFWTGCIDHACTAWVADMMWGYVDDTGDWDYLREKVLPFMTGAMRVYEEMLEPDGDHYRLPVSVSPEYRGARMDAWGANASFQLAAAHRLLDDLEQAHAALGTCLPDRFADIKRKLPLFCPTEDPATARIALWDGVDLEESHRHHSHLAAICPFDTIDTGAEAFREIVQRSIHHWTKMGMGLWSGWCMPWASMIHTRLGNGDTAGLILEVWRRVFTNEGRGSRHDPMIPGVSVLGGGGASPHRREIMQLDGGFGAVTAIQDMMVHTRRGVIHVFAGVSSSWEDCSFGPMPCGGGFSVSGKKEGGRVRSITVAAGRRGSCRVFVPWLDEVRSLTLEANERVTLEAPAPG